MNMNLIKKILLKVSLKKKVFKIIFIGVKIFILLLHLSIYNRTVLFKYLKCGIKKLNN